MKGTLKRIFKWMSDDIPLEDRARIQFEKTTAHYGPPDRFNRNRDGTYVCPIIEQEWQVYLNLAIGEDMAW